MKKNLFRILTFMLALAMVLGGCSGSDPTPTTAPTTAPTEPPAPPEYTLEKEPGHNQVTFYWDNANKTDLSKADIWIWWDGKEGSGYLLHECAYGAKTVVNVPEGVEQVGFIVRTGCSDPGGSAWGDATKDYPNDRFAIITGVDRLVGTRVNATDLRAGAAMVIAGLMAEGVTEIGGVGYILRGYENIDKKLIQLGARIERIQVPETF